MKTFRVLLLVLLFSALSTANVYSKPFLDPVLDEQYLSVCEGKIWDVLELSDGGVLIIVDGDHRMAYWTSNSSAAGWNVGDVIEIRSYPPQWFNDEIRLWCVLGHGYTGELVSSLNLGVLVWGQAVRLVEYEYSPITERWYRNAGYWLDFVKQDGGCCCLLYEDGEDGEDGDDGDGVDCNCDRYSMRFEERKQDSLASSLTNGHHYYHILCLNPEWSLYPNLAPKDYLICLDTGSLCGGYGSCKRIETKREHYIEDRYLPMEDCLEE